MDRRARHILRAASLMLAAAAALIVSSCANDPFSDNFEGRCTFDANFEQTEQTRTSVATDGSVVWTSGDMITVFNSSNKSGAAFNLKSESAGSLIGHFEGSITGSAPFYAIYPASLNGSLTTGSPDKVTVNLPDTQQYAVSTVASGANPSIAVADGLTLNFKNLCGILVIKVKGDATITKAELTTASSELLWGRARVKMNYGSDGPQLSFTSSADEQNRKLTLNCPGGVALNTSAATEFRFIVPAGTLAGGFSVKFTDSEGGSMTKTAEASSSNAIKRSKVLTMPEFIYEIPSADDSFLSCTAYGAYDLSTSPASAIIGYSEYQDQYSCITKGANHTFRLMKTSSGKALCITVPKSIGNASSGVAASVVTMGFNGLESRCSVDVVKVDGTKYWLMDASAKKGFIIEKE